MDSSNVVDGTSCDAQARTGVDDSLLTWSKQDHQASTRQETVRRVPVPLLRFGRVMRCTGQSQMRMRQFPSVSDNALRSNYLFTFFL